MRRTPKGLTYAQGRPHPSDPDYDGPPPGRDLSRRDVETLVDEQRRRDLGTGAAPASSPATPAPSTTRGRPARRAPAARSSTAPVTPASSPAPSRFAGRRPAAAVGGIIAGLFLWPAAVNWLRGGQAQAVGWFGAKFFNEPYGAGSTGSAQLGSTLGSTIAGMVPTLTQAAETVAAKTPKPNTTLGGRVGRSSQKQP